MTPCRKTEKYFGDKAKCNLVDEMARCGRTREDLSDALKSNDVAVVHANMPTSTLSVLFLGGSKGSDPTDDSSVRKTMGVRNENNTLQSYSKNRGC